VDDAGGRGFCDLKPGQLPRLALSALDGSAGSFVLENLRGSDKHQHNAAEMARFGSVAGQPAQSPRMDIAGGLPPPAPLIMRLPDQYERRTGCAMALILRMDACGRCWKRFQNRLADYALRPGADDRCLTGDIGGDFLTEPRLGY